MENLLNEATENYVCEVVEDTMINDNCTDVDLRDPNLGDYVATGAVALLALDGLYHVGKFLFKQGKKAYGKIKVAMAKVKEETPADDTAANN